MPKLKNLSAKEVLSILKQMGFSVIGQRGSHIKIEKAGHSITVPNHKELDKGTLKAIYNQALPFTPESELRKHFYTK